MITSVSSACCIGFAGVVICLNQGGFGRFPSPFQSNRNRRHAPTMRNAAVAILCLATATAQAQKLESLWYSTSGENSTKSFLTNASHIDIVAPQVFALTAKGTIAGKVDPRVIAKAKEAGVKVMPLVTNPGFNQSLIHTIVSNPAISKKAVESLVALCRDNHFDGIQFDIENIHVKDKDALTRFMRDAATALHAIRCTVSAAVVPRASDDPGPTNYHKWMYENWRGAYDYKALAEALDFISYMTYAQHGGSSTPGPVAGYSWMEECLKFALAQGVPSEKISLGIPSYSDYWYSSYSAKDGARVRATDISFEHATQLLAKSGAQLTWDDREKAAWAMWSNAGVYEYLWIEDARAFAAKVELARRYKLRGYSVWVLGMEDPAVWALPR
jgi:spore germination protein YaaH